MAEEEKKRLSPLTLAAGAGASILSMVIGSFFKTAGTVAGAAIASVTYSVGAFWFEDKARRAHARVTARRHQGKPPTTYTHLADLPLERSLIHAEASEVITREWGLSKRLGVSGGILAVCLVSAIGVLFLIEGATGKTLSSNLGRGTEYGTTLGGYSLTSLLQPRVLQCSLAPRLPSLAPLRALEPRPRCLSTQPPLPVSVTREYRQDSYATVSQPVSPIDIQAACS